MSPYANLERPPLDGRALHRALVHPGGLWTQVEVVAETGSTNADLAQAVRDGAEAGRVLVAEQQTAGRGRLSRAWSAPARSALTFSVLLRPRTPVVRYGWLPLLVGVAVVEAVGRLAQLEVALKWPNDVLAGERKLAGILAELPAPGAVVLGVGLNVTQQAAELPVPCATSLLLEDSLTTDRDPLLRALLRAVESWYGRWEDASGDPRASGLRAAYLEHSATVGRQVRAHRSGAEDLLGQAVEVDDDGRLVVQDAAGARHPLSAADVVHLR